MASAASWANAHVAAWRSASRSGGAGRGHGGLVAAEQCEVAHGGLLLRRTTTARHPVDGEVTPVLDREISTQDRRSWRPICVESRRAGGGGGAGAAGPTERPRLSSKKPVDLATRQHQVEQAGALLAPGSGVDDRAEDAHAGRAVREDRRARRRGRPGRPPPWSTARPWRPTARRRPPRASRLPRPPARPRGRRRRSAPRRRRGPGCRWRRTRRRPGRCARRRRGRRTGGGPWPAARTGPAYCSGTFPSLRTSRLSERQVMVDAARRGGVDQPPARQPRPRTGGVEVVIDTASVSTVAGDGGGHRCLQPRRMLSLFPTGRLH